MVDAEKLSSLGSRSPLQRYAHLIFGQGRLVRDTILGEMSFPVRGSRVKFKVPAPVVLRNPVAVVDDLRGAQEAPQDTLHHQPVLRHVADLARPGVVGSVLEDVPPRGQPRMTTPARRRPIFPPESSSLKRPEWMGRKVAVQHFKQPHSRTTL